jgi:hypothetical protein
VFKRTAALWEYSEDGHIVYDKKVYVDTWTMLLPGIDKKMAEEDAGERGTQEMSNIRWKSTEKRMKRGRK